MKSTKEINEYTNVFQNSEMPSVSLDGEVGMMNINKGLYYSTDQVGTRIWELMSEPVIVSEIIKTLLKEYSVEENICREHVLEFVKELYNHKLILVN